MQMQNLVCISQQKNESELAIHAQHRCREELAMESLDIVQPNQRLH